MIAGHHGSVNSIQLRGDFLVSASSDKTIKLWQVSTGALVREFVGHQHGLACVQYDGKRIISGSNDHTIRVWDVEVREKKKDIFLFIYFTHIYILDWCLYYGIRGSQRISKKSSIRRK